MPNFDGMKPIASNAENPFPVFVAHVPCLADILSLPIPSKYFTVLLCADFRAESTEQLSAVTEFLIERGNVWFCSWGEDCERAHDICDWQYVEMEMEDRTKVMVMTTWHSDESLEEALRFALFVATAEDPCWDDCSTVVVSVGNATWRAEIDAALSDIAGLEERCIAE
ncbi:MAG: DUF7684 family protein [Verrucomicrobiia bacterium]|jgi:hypothetical protein